MPLDDPLYVSYHDEEWGLPERDESKLFELLNLEGAQAAALVPGRAGWPLNALDALQSLRSLVAARI